MIINHNLNALNAHRNMLVNVNAAGKSMEKLSSGLRINRAGDDAAGLSISEKMRAQINGLDTASRNAQDGISLIQTAEGALNETQSILQRMRELAVQAGNDTNTPADRGQIQKEINQLTSEITRIGNTTQFNTQNLINGGSAVTSGDTKTFVFQIGANEGQTFKADFGDMRSVALGISAASGANFASATTDALTDVTAGTEYALSVGNATVAGNAVSVISAAIDTVSSERAKLGAYQNRLEHTIANLGTSSENLTAAESRIRDVDMANEMVTYSKNNILAQAAQAMLAQANQQPQ
ncbi:MAG TPA: flagellin, partial [Clostridiaceae bacterium]|nr:flagellin [Clostridiaceae bacterium]